MLLIKGVGGGILESLPLVFDGVENILDGWVFQDVKPTELILDGWVFQDVKPTELIQDGYFIVESRLGKEGSLDGYYVIETKGGVVLWQM